MTFSLRTLVRETGRSTLAADPGAVAEEVLRRIDPEDVPTALRQSLRHFVRQVLSEERMQTHIGAPQTGTSAKVLGIREHWQRSLRDRLNVAEGVWKFLGDCERVDLEFAAAQRREMAARQRAKAAQYETLAGLLDEHGVVQVKDLPAEVLMASIGRAA